MSQAHRAPMDYQRRVVVTAHSVERLRERVVGTELASRSDRDLGNLIDANVARCMNEKVYEEWYERTEDRGVQHTYAVELDEIASTEPLTAVVRPNDRGGPTHVVLTLLTEGMVTRNVTSGRWAKDESGGLAPGSKELTHSPMAAALAGVEPAPVQSPGSFAGPDRTIEPEPEVIVSWSERGEEEYRRVVTVGLAELVNELVSDRAADPKTIRIWEPSAKKVAIKVEICG